VSSHGISTSVGSRDCSACQWQQLFWLILQLVIVVEGACIVYSLELGKLQFLCVNCWPLNLSKTISGTLAINLPTSAQLERWKPGSLLQVIYWLDDPQLTASKHWTLRSLKAAAVDCGYCVAGVYCVMTVRS